MDLLQADAFTPFWPFSAKTFSFDVAPFIDPWLIVILVAAILFPELVRLVSDEIGARAKRPRGRNGAIAGLFFALFYFGLRASADTWAVGVIGIAGHIRNVHAFNRAVIVNVPFHKYLCRRHSYQPVGYKKLPLGI